MPFENLLVERDGAVTIITLSRPNVLNALNAQTLDELTAAFDAVAADADTRVVILTGAGEKAFVAGADINELAVQTPVGGRDHARRGQRLFDQIERLGKPVIAAVNGFALGGGCELAMACTLRLAADTARFGQPEINLGIIPGYAGSQRLPRLVGRGRAQELLLTGDMIGADEAWRIGLVNKVVPAAQLESHVDNLTTAMLKAPRISLTSAKEYIRTGPDMPVAGAVEYARNLHATINSAAEIRKPR